MPCRGRGGERERCGEREMKNEKGEKDGRVIDFVSV